MVCNDGAADEAGRYGDFPCEFRIAGELFGRQENAKQKNKHDGGRNAVGEGGDVATVLFACEPGGAPGVVEVTDHDRDGGAGQHLAIDDRRGKTHP